MEIFFGVTILWMKTLTHIGKGSYMQTLQKSVWHDNFAMYNSAPPAIIQAYNYGDGNGPDPDHLQLDMTSGAELQWNKAVLGILLEKFQENRRAEWWPLPDRSNSYIADLIWECYKHAAAV